MVALVDEALLTLDDLCRAGAVAPDWVTERVQAGLLVTRRGEAAAWHFDAVALQRVRCMVRLERDFDAVPELAALVADLQAEIDGCAPGWPRRPRLAGPADETATPAAQIARFKRRCATSPPSGALASSSLPPMRCMALSTIARPRPAPVAAVRAASPRKKGVVSCASFSGATPGPLSRTLTMTQGPVFSSAR